MQAVIDGRGNRVTNTYDAVGRLTVLEDSLNQRTSYTYDAVGNQTLRIDGNGQRTTYLYDAINRPTEAVYQDGSRVTHTYDALGRRTVLSDNTGRTSYTYDAASQMTQVAYPGNKVLTNVYDAVGNRTVLQDPDSGRTSYTYDALNRLTSLLNPFNERTTWQYDAVNRATTQILANGTQARSTFDAAGNLTELKNVKSDETVISSFAYTCDGVGNRTQVMETNGDVVSWSYDNTYQLTNERRSGANAYNVTYTYDAVGNRTVKEDSGARTTYAYNAGNQLLTEQSPTTLTSYTYDANGNTTVKNAAGVRTTYTWDGENRLTQVDTASGSVSYTYDAEGLRCTGPGVKYVWDGEKVLLETDTGGNTTARYTLSEEVYGDLVSQRRSGVSRFYHFDGLGSTDRLTDANQAVTDSYTYLAFGEEKASSGSTTNPFHYVGRGGYYRDGQTSLLYLRARYYEPGVGRFLSYDKEGEDGRRFIYVMNRPLVLVDPSGLSIADCRSKDHSKEPSWGANQSQISDPVRADYARVYCHCASKCMHNMEGQNKATVQNSFTAWLNTVAPRSTREQRDKIVRAMLCIAKYESTFDASAWRDDTYVAGVFQIGGPTWRWVVKQGAQFGWTVDENKRCDVRENPKGAAILLHRVCWVHKEWSIQQVIKNQWTAWSSCKNEVNQIDTTCKGIMHGLA